MTVNATPADAVVIRDYLPEDFPQVCRVHDRARPFELTGSSLSGDLVPLAESTEDLPGFHRSAKFVAVSGDQVIGFTGVDGAFLSWLYVDPDWHRLGIGRRLLRHALGHADPAADTYTLTPAGNAGAIALYESEGFRHAKTFEGRSAGRTLRISRYERPAGNATGPGAAAG